MGACCSVKSKDKIAENFHKFVYKNLKRRIPNIPENFDDLKKEIQSELKISKFEVFIQGEKITSNHQYQSFIHSSQSLEFTIKDLEETQTSVSKKPSIDSNLCPNLPPSLDCHLCKVEISQSKFLTTLIIHEGFICIHQAILPKAPVSLFCSVTGKSKANSKLRYLNTFDQIHFYKLEKVDLSKIPGISQESIADDDDFNAFLDGRMIPLKPNADDPDLLSSTERAFEVTKEGESLFTKEKLLGLVVKIIDINSIKYLRASTLLQICMEILLVPSVPSLNQGDSEDLAKFSGSVVDKQGNFLMPWVLISTKFVLVPKQLLKAGDETLGLNVLSEKFKLERFQVDKSDFFEVHGFSIYKIEAELTESLDEDLVVEPRKKGKIYFGEGHSVSVKRKNDEIFHVSQAIDSLFQGYFVVARGKITGMVLKVHGYEVTLVSGLMLKDKISQIKKSKGLELQESHFAKSKVKKNYPLISPSAISFQNSPEYISRAPKEFEEEIIIAEKPKSFLEAGNDHEDAFEGEFEFNPTLTSQPDLLPENFSYAFIDNKLIKYSSALYKPIIIDKHLSMQEGGSFLTTPQGLIYTVGELALVVSEEDQQLQRLHTQHYFHCSVWHQNAVFVISGENCVEVEKFSFAEGAWEIVPSLSQPRVSAAACSTGNFIYVMGGVVEERIVKSILKFAQVWEEIEATLPEPMRSLGLFADRDQFVVFGGKGQSGFVGKYFLIDFNFKVTMTAEFKMVGEFSQRSVGVADGGFSIVISEDNMIEFSNGLFKVVSS